MKKEINLRKKTLIAALLTLLLLAGFFAVVLSTRSAMITAQDKDQNHQKIEGILEMMVMLENSYQDSFDSFYNGKLRVSARLTAAALRLAMEEGDLRDGLLLEDGMLVHILNGKVILPKGVRADMLSLPDGFWLEENEQDRFFYCDYAPQPDGECEEVLVVWDWVADGAVYLSWTTGEALQKAVFSRENERDILDLAEQVYGGYLLTVLSEGDKQVFVSQPAPFAGFESPEDMGFTPGLLQNGDGQIDIQGTSYLFVARKQASEADKDDLTVIFLDPTGDQDSQSIRLVWVLVVGALLILAPVLVWLTEVQKTAMLEALDKRRKNRLRPSAVRRSAVFVGAAGVLLMFGIAAFLNTMSNLYEVSTDSQTASAALLTTMDKRSVWQEEIQKDEKDWADYFARRISFLLDRYPDLLTQENLDEFNQIIGSNYLMIFDPEGNELLSSGPYVDFTLGTDPEDSSSDFRRLLMGVESIVHEPSEESITGLYSIQAGARLPFNSKKYGAVLLSVGADPDVTAEIERETDELLRVLAPFDSLCLYVDRESSQIEYASDSSLKGVSTQYVGLRLSDTALEGVDYFKINTGRYYGVFQEQGGKISYYLNSSAAAGANTLRFAGLASVLFLFLYAALSLWMLWGYTDAVFQKAQAAAGKRSSHPDAESDLNNAMLRYRQDMDKRRPSLRTFWSEQAPTSKAMLVFQFLLALFLAASGVTFLASSRAGQFALLSYLLKGEWSRGLNLFALASIFLLSAVVGLVVNALRFVTELFANTLESLGETLCRLLFSLTEYIALLTVLFYSFSFLGVNTSALIGAVGLLTLALSLGAQNLVADMLAGITIILDREFKVGDVVEIDDFKGMVEEIGVRSTKLIGSGDNIKIIANRNIDEVLNMTYLNSWYPMELRIPGDQPLEEIEDMLVRELPKLSGKIEGVIGAPLYKGVLSLGDGGMLGGKNAATLSVIAEYREEDYLKVKRNLTRAIKALFKKEGYSYY